MNISKLSKDGRRKNGGTRGSRTLDLRLRRPLLYPLSYCPTKINSTIHEDIFGVCVKKKVPFCKEKGKLFLKYC